MTAISPMDINEVDSMYREHHSWLSLFIQRRLSCPHISADLFQDTYLRLLVSGKLPERKDSRRYLTHIAKGLVVDTYRRRRIEAAYLELLERVPEEVAASPETQTMMVEVLVEI
ncbi:RNA polymerase subunit sigma, partial [Vibrio xuii]